MPSFKEQPEDSSRRFGTISEYDAAEYCGVGFNKFVRLRYLRQGPPFVLIGRDKRYRIRDLDAWIDSKVVYPNKPTAEVRILSDVREG
jgi:hypothetical protein